jgi:hypothetical protein
MREATSLCFFFTPSLLCAMHLQLAHLTAQELSFFAVRLVHTHTQMRDNTIAMGCSFAPDIQRIEGLSRIRGDSTNHHHHHHHHTRSKYQESGAYCKRKKGGKRKENTQAKLNASRSGHVCRPPPPPSPPR